MRGLCSEAEWTCYNWMDTKWTSYHGKVTKWTDYANDLLFERPLLLSGDRLTVWRAAGQPSTVACFVHGKCVKPSNRHLVVSIYSTAGSYFLHVVTYDVIVSSVIMINRCIKRWWAFETVTSKLWNACIVPVSFRVIYVLLVSNKKRKIYICIHVSK